MADENRPDLRGWLTPTIAWILGWLTWPGELLIGKRLHAQARIDDATFTAERAKRVDTYVAICLVIGIVAFGLLGIQGVRDSLWAYPLLVFVCYKIIEIPSTAVRVSVLDRLSVKDPQRHAVSSRERITILGMANYVELIFAFAALYAFLTLGDTHPDRWDTYLCFSVFTQLTIGYGDIAPTGWARLAAALQGLTATLLLIVLVSRFIGLLHPAVDLQDLFTESPKKRRSRTPKARNPS